jgi:hypothetical protein
MMANRTHPCDPALQRMIKSAVLLDDCRRRPAGPTFNDFATPPAKGRNKPKRKMTLKQQRQFDDIEQRQRRRSAIIATPSSDLNMYVHDGVFYSNRGAQLTGLPTGSGLDDWTLSFWIRLDQVPAGSDFILDGAASNRQEQLAYNASYQLIADARDWLGGQYGNGNSSLDAMVINQLHHIQYAASRASNKFQLWVDGTLEIDNAYGTASDPLGNETNWFIFNSNGGGTGTPENGTQVGGFWFGNEFVATPVGVFIEAAGVEPTALTGGADGSTYTGTQPLIWFNELADWNSGTNRGTGGAFTVGAGSLSAIP